MSGTKSSGIGPEQKKLIEIFLQAETDIINELARLRGQGLVDYHVEAALERVQRILAQMDSDAWEYTPKMIERQFYVKHPEARKPMEFPETAEKHRAAYENALALTLEQTAVVEALTMRMMGEVTEASATVMGNLTAALVGRREDDIFARIGLEQVALREATGQGTYRALPQFVDTLRREGVTAFVDKAGRKWSLHTYGAMVSRTTARQAGVLSSLTADPEHDLYQISSHSTSCPVCAPYEGRVYSKSGLDPDFPPLAAAFGKIDSDGPDTLVNTYLCIHPNCLHVLRRWTPAGKTPEEIQKIKDFSSPQKNPFSRDPRTEKQIKAYREKERARAQWLRDYRQWENYRVTLGDKVPKTFDTFLKHKRAGDEKYKAWRAAYREANGISTLSETLPLPPNMAGVVPKGTQIQKTRRIAGAGTSHVLRDAQYLADEFGGDPLKWEKKGGIIQGKYTNYDIHWYELDGVHRKEKVKGVKPL